MMKRVLHISNNQEKKTRRTLIIRQVPLSTDAYVFSKKQINKKRKQVRSTIHEAESLIAIEFGYDPDKTK